MRTHGPKTPRSIRGLRNRRNLSGALDAKSTQDADLSQGEMVSPFGKGFFSVKVPGVDTPFIVADQTGGRSFAPGTSVMLASYRGRPGQAVIGGAPAGKKGGVSSARNTRRRGTAAADQAANQYAFGFSGSDMVAALYYDGTYLSTRASYAAPGTAWFTGCIVVDSSVVVGDGSALMRDGDTLYVWDVDGAATYSYSVPAGWTNATQLYYQNGFLYWCEIEDVSNPATFDVRLRRADTDLANVSTLSTYTSPDASVDYGGLPWLSWYTDSFPILPLAFAVDADAAILYVDGKIWDEVEAQEWHGLQIRFLLSGATSYRAFDTPELGVDGVNPLIPLADFPCATLATTFAIAEPITSTQSVLSKDDDASTTAANLWGASDLDGNTVSAFGVGTGLATLQVHDAVNGHIIRGIASGTVITTAIEAFDETPNYPSAMFYSGV